MIRPAFALLFALSGGIFGQTEDSGIVFTSDVSLVRVDAQVLDRNNRAITGLEAEDFVLKENGRPQDIRNFAREEMPADVLLLLDVSGSMRPHIERVFSASSRALQVLGADDRVAIMVFDRATRLRLPFRKTRDDIAREFDALLRQETFDGGTDITRALFDASAYMSKHARQDARRAIVILTDDQTERNRDEDGVARALGDTVLMALLAPDALGTGSLGGWGGGWPQAGGTLGGIILGRRGPLGMPTPMPRRSSTRSAGTAEIAKRSGGDSLRVDESSALEHTLTRIRQRYTLHFNLPEGVKPGQERDIEVELTADARRRYPDAEVRFRRLNQGGENTVLVSQRESAKPMPPIASPTPTAAPVASTPPPTKTEGGWRKADGEQNAQPKQGGWRRVKPGEQP